MPDEPSQLPKPDALRKPRPAAPLPPVSRLLEDPLASKPAPPADEDEKPETPASGLGELDAAHVVLGSLTSGIGRAVVIFLVCMLAFGLTESCHNVSLVLDGWRDGGMKGFLRAALNVPGAILASPVEVFGGGLLDSSGVSWVYLLLAVSGIFIAFRSEISILRLGLFYALLTAFHAAVHFKMKNLLSLVLWFAVLGGFLWLYRWLWRRQNPELLEPAEDEVEQP